MPPMPPMPRNLRVNDKRTSSDGPLRRPVRSAIYLSAVLAVLMLVAGLTEAKGRAHAVSFIAGGIAYTTALAFLTMGIMLAQGRIQRAIRRYMFAVVGAAVACVAALLVILYCYPDQLDAVSILLRISQVGLEAGGLGLVCVAASGWVLYAINRRK